MFDPETIADTATYELPQQTCVGVECVVVNGQTVIEGEPKGFIGKSKRPGRFLRHSK
jgi:hypothetical protein